VRHSASGVRGLAGRGVLRGSVTGWRTLRRRGGWSKPGQYGSGVGFPEVRTCSCARFRRFRRRSQVHTSRGYVEWGVVSWLCRCWCGTDMCWGPQRDSMRFAFGKPPASAVRRPAPSIASPPGSLTMVAPSRVRIVVIVIERLGCMCSSRGGYAEALRARDLRSPTLVNARSLVDSAQASLALSPRSLACSSVVRVTNNFVNRLNRLGSVRERPLRSPQSPVPPAGFDAVFLWKTAGLRGASRLGSFGVRTISGLRR